jgi:DNA-binding MarR family transcriptional regulator
MAGDHPEPGGGPELFRLVRYWSRRWAPGVAARSPHEVHVQHVQVVTAVDAAVPTPGEDATVTAVARQLGVDRSVASRMISEAVSAGYLLRRTPAADARRVGIRLTRAGRQLLAAAHRWQQATFDRMVAGWPAADRRRLARYLHRLAAEVVDEE